MAQVNRFNIGDGFQIQPIDIGHREYIGLISPDTAFWALVKKKELSRVLTDSSLLKRYRGKAKAFDKEMNALRFGLRPSAVYLNPTDRCNLNCAYCYLPENLRRKGRHMSGQRLLDALEILKSYFRAALPLGQIPQIVFHGAEPLLNKKAVFSAIDKFRRDFSFGIQTNAALLDAEAVEFLTSREISIGLSLDGHTPEIADRLRRSWAGRGVSRKVMGVIKRLKGYGNYSVICTITKENMASQAGMIEFLHGAEAPSCMLNPIRCTLAGSRRYKPADSDAAKYYLEALDRAYQLYRKTGRKLIVANFANILLSIIAPTARRLMCDISPCGAGRCFFAVSASGDLFPCSEFIGIKKFKGGNIFSAKGAALADALRRGSASGGKDDISDAFKTAPFKPITGRRIENIGPCYHCAIRHFCGAPCPAEAYGMNGSVETRGAFCELYAEQVRYAFRLIADNKADAYLWDDWDRGAVTTFKMTGF